MVARHAVGVQEAFDPAKGLFMSTESGELYPNPAAHRHFANPTASLRFLGAMLGKAMYEGIMIEVRLLLLFKPVHRFVLGIVQK
jgi:ubiquitin-protein ligase E3 C